MRLKDKVVIITGAAGGIGFAAVKKFVQEGAKVVLADYDESQLASREKELHDKRMGEFLSVVVDVSDRNSVDRMTKAAVDTFGTIDVLVNNAGITKDALLTKMEPVDFQKVIDVNLTGVFNCTQAVVEHMINNGKGKIINTSSVSGVYGNIGQTNYAASKAAVIGMTKTWAKELGKKGINVNAVVPGFTETNMVTTVPAKVIESIKGMIPLKRLGKPDDIANAYVFLASNEADYINGAILHVDGGIAM